jgi:hypothetical protein
LSCRQRLNGSIQGVSIPERLLRSIRGRSLKGYIEVVDANLVRPPANLPPAGIGQPITDDSGEPRHQRARRIIGRSHGMDREQHVLNDVLHVAFADRPSPCADDVPDPRRNSPEQSDIGVAVALLRARHEAAQMLVRLRGLIHLPAIVTFRAVLPNTPVAADVGGPASRLDAPTRWRSA